MKTGIKFFSLLKDAFMKYEEKWFSYFGIAFVTMGIGTYLQILLAKRINFFFLKDFVNANDPTKAVEIPIGAALQANLISGSLSSIIPGILGLIMIAGIIHMLHSKNVKFQDGLMFGIKKIGTFIKTALYVLWYTMSWVILAIGSVIAVYAVKIISKYEVTATAGEKMDPAQVKTMVEGIVNDLSTSSTGILALVLLGLMLVFLVIATIRSVRATFAYYALVEKNNGTIQAVKKSISAVSGRWGLVFFYGILIGLMAAIVLSIIQAAAMKLFVDVEIKNQIGLFISLVMTAVFVPITVAFQYLFYQKLKK